MITNELCFRKTCGNSSKKLFDKSEKIKNSNESKSSKSLIIKKVQRLTAYRLFQL